jgi:serine/threonine-protein kinase RsbW
VSSLESGPARNGAGADQASGLRAPWTVVTLSLAADLHAPSAARAAVVDGLTGRVANDVLGDARLVVSELVSNSVRHAGLAADSVVRVGAEITSGMLRLQVDDAGTAGTVALRAPGRDGGFGLHLVDALAHRWGVTRQGSTRVWVELECWPASG